MPMLKAMLLQALLDVAGNGTVLHAKFYSLNESIMCCHGDVICCQQYITTYSHAKFVNLLALKQHGKVG